MGGINLSHCYHIFLVSVPEMIVTSYSVTYCMCIPGKPWICFTLLLCNLWWAQIVGYVLACRSYSFVCTLHTFSLSSLCKPIWRHWNYKMLVRYILSSVWVRYSIYSQLSIVQYMRLCVFSLTISPVLIERIYLYCVLWSSNRKYELLPIYRARSWNNGMRCMYVFLYSYHWKHVVNIVI